MLVTLTGLFCESKNHTSFSLVKSSYTSVIGCNEKDLYKLLLYALWATMEEIVLKLDIPEEFSAKFKNVLSEIVEELKAKFELAIAKELVSDSKFTSEDADFFSEKIKSGM